MNLNEEQYQAVTYGDGPCMVIAGPGSGKTTVLVERIRFLVRERGIPPEQILVITFTAAAADEMRKRFRKRCREIPSEPVFGTFHAVFFRMLSEVYHYQASDILTEREQYRILAEIISREAPERISDLDLPKRCLSAPAETDEAILPKIRAAYAVEKELRHRIDYDDMLTKTLHLLRENEAVRRAYQKRFRYILVDEFQDINPVQKEITALLLGPERNLFIVGDDDQSIYAFRGAKPEMMLRFPEEYPGAGRIVLGTNYRSYREIVRASLRLIRCNRSRFEKKLKSGRGKGGCVTADVLNTEQAVYERILQELLTLRAQGLPWEEMAVLYRTQGSSAAFRELLVRNRIPFSTLDAMENIYHHPVMEPVYACMKYALGDRSRGNFMKFCNRPYRGIRREDLSDPEVDLQKLERSYREKGDFRAAERIEKLRRQLSFPAFSAPPYAMINYIRKGMGYDRYLQEEAERKGKDPADLFQILDRVQESSAEALTPDIWFQEISAYDILFERSQKEMRKTDGVQLRTMHAAKGLEYEAVFILGLTEGVIPHEKAVHPEDLEEERRILYVGMTRAKRYLYLLGARERYGKPARVSRFLAEIME